LIYHYRAYGLICVSNVPISGFCPHTLLPQSVKPDIYLDLLSVSPDWVRTVRNLTRRTLHAKPVAAPNGNSGCTVKVLGAQEAYELIYNDGTEFFIDGSATNVWGSCRPGLGIDFLATYLRGPVMGFILRCRGVIALHASAANIDGRAIVLVGESESGKSTIAAALALRGAPVLCEDVTPLKLSGNTFCVEPGYAQVALWPDSVEALFGTSDALPRLTPGWEKCFLTLDDTSIRFESKERSLSVIYLLAPRSPTGDAPRIDQISPREALLGLVQNTYMNWLLDREQRAVEFDFLSALAQRMQVRRIVPHSDPAKIADLCDLIVKDAQDHQDSTFLVSSR
jgi:hypothetical protein